VPRTPYKRLLDNLFDGVYATDRNRVITYWNQGAERIAGYGAKEVVGSSCRDGILVHIDEAGTNLCRERCPLAMTIDDGQPREADVFLHHQDGHRLPVRIRISPLRDAEGNITGAVEAFSDNTRNVSALQKIEELERMAYLDPLTHLPNRRYVETHLQARLDECRRYGWPFGILYIDIDNFKTVNDAHGHDAGDEVLKTVAKTLHHATRSFDVVGRWGGEEFLAVLVAVDAGKLRIIGERFRALVENSECRYGGVAIRVTISLGGVLFSPGDTLDSIVRRADELLYRSKEIGRNRLTMDPRAEGPGPPLTPRVP
jgi:diguanylate cyclase (GGDEF)-like protein/PAS domain S-box-containing protein